MSLITKPGIYTDIPSEAYYADPCPDPSLTQSVAKLLIDKSPLHAWHAHPKLNKAYQPSEDAKFNIGNCAHLHLLGRGKEIVVVDAPDWRTKDARAQRDEALAAGKVPVLAEQNERAVQMANAARTQLDAMGLTIPNGGASEVVLAWKEGELWLRSMVDWLSGDGLILFDYKTTTESAAPHTIGTKMVADGWHIQAAMHERGLDVLVPQDAGRRRHIFACQECTQPYAMTVVEIPEAAKTIGRKQLDYAVTLWGRCIRTNIFPGYPRAVQMPDVPGWFENKWLEREIAESDAPQSLLMAG